ncbi:twin-arginine translocase TatA/TatE family subunit [Carboxylicivirga caseinilyticus]|uniref:twin-arginine translocase TatA/TatE family subunit n=1 Tax=Carboxylicivirga caseinilyticus TaxID=3417572 RepID=UPI003D34F978|nr:twin-arginine translocase TatA/TatE family subunit [Marinilabiliaceae bacterium A049]
MMNLLFISGGEILIVGLVVLLLFGAKSIPDVARMLGKGMNEFKRASDEIKRELRDQTSDIRRDISEARTFVNDEVKDVQKAVDTDLSVDDDPYNLKEAEKQDKDQPEVKSTKKKINPIDNTPDGKAEGDGPISREDVIEE